MTNKAIILIGGPSKGTRFRPLSLYLPKPLFPIGGVPLIYHSIERLSQVKNLKEIILLGSFTDIEQHKIFEMCKEHFNINIKYLKENEAMGSAGGVFRYKREIMLGGVDKFFVVNGDVLGDMPFDKMLEFHEQHCSDDQYVMMGKFNNSEQSHNFGCINYNQNTKKVLHFVEKPTEFTSNVISCGAYLFTPKIFDDLQSVLMHSNTDFPQQNGDLCNNMTMGRDLDSEEYGDISNNSPSKQLFTHCNKSGNLSFELDIFPNLAGPNGHLNAFVLPQETPWIQVKSSGSAAYANEIILNLYARNRPNILAISSTLARSGDKEAPCVIKGNVFIHPTASVHPSAVLGPNVSVCAGVEIGSGARISHSIICDNVKIRDHAFVTCSIVGWNSTVGRWSRIEGTMMPLGSAESSTDVQTLFTPQGKLNPSITIIANDVHIQSELVVYNAIVLPHKELKECTQNQIVL